MRFFRARKNFGLMALLAFALQFAISVAHVHPAHTRPSQTSPLACRTFLPPAAQHPCAPLPVSNECCPTCLALNLTGPAVQCDAPAFPLPAFTQTAPNLRMEQAPLCGLPAAAFQARAPPSLMTV